MWIFDGEEWINDSPADERETEQPKWPSADQFQPELQIIEIVPLNKREPVPPYPSI